MHALNTRFHRNITCKLHVNPKLLINKNVHAKIEEEKKNHNPDITKTVQHTESILQYVIISISIINQLINQLIN